MKSGLLACLVACAVLAAGCVEGGVDLRESAPPAGSAGGAVVSAPAADEPHEPDDDVAPTPAQWTSGIVRQEYEVTGAAILAEVRTARNEGFDRVVFEFDDDEMPSFHIEYVDRPVRQCGSGHVVPIAGDGWLAVRLEPARAHDEEGRPTIEARSVRPELPVLLELTLTCDFEAHVEWVLGVASPNRYRVMELREPTRLVVDVRH